MSRIFAIGDLHLSGMPARKPMEVFGESWRDHWLAIQASWQQQVQAEDYVLLAGDTSWATHFAQAEEDLLAIDRLPGQKIMIKGNHDFWWLTANKLRQLLPPTLAFIHNNYSVVGDVAICGSRGWTNPDDEYFTAEDQKIYEREQSRIHASLAAAKQAGFSRMLLLTHYPMFYPPHDQWLRTLAAVYPIEQYVCGHLHGPSTALLPPDTCVGHIPCHLVSCDALDFTVKYIMEV